MPPEIDEPSVGFSLLRSSKGGLYFNLYKISVPVCVLINSGDDIERDEIQGVWL